MNKSIFIMFLLVCIFSQGSECYWIQPWLRTDPYNRNMNYPKLPIARVLRFFEFLQKIHIDIKNEKSQSRESKPVNFNAGRYLAF